MSLVDTLRDEWGLDGQVLKDVLRMLANTMPSPADARDHSHYDKEPEDKTINWGRWVGNIENQQRQPRCVAQSCEVIARVHTNRKRGYDMMTPFKMADFNAQNFYELLKLRDGYPMIPGTFPRVGMKCLKKSGIVERHPTPGRYKCHEYWRCNSLEDVKNDLLTVGPVSICMRVFPSMYEAGGVIPKPGTRERQMGLHQVAATRLTEEAVGITNSWGPSWGDYGQSLLPFDLFKQLVTEAWCAK